MCIRAQKGNQLFALGPLQPVQRQGQEQRRSAGQHVLARDQLVVLVDHEVFFAETAVETSRSIGDRCRHVNQLDAALEFEPALFLCDESGAGERQRQRNNPQSRPATPEFGNPRSEIHCRPHFTGTFNVCSPSPGTGDALRRSTCGTMPSSVRKLTR